MSCEKAIYEALHNANERHGIPFLCQDDSLELVMSRSIHDGLVKIYPHLFPHMQRATLSNFCGVSIRIDEDMDGFVIRKREGL